MPAEMVSSNLVPAHGVESILIMDDYGTEFILVVLVSDSTNRQQSIDAALAQQTANQTAIEDYATAHGIDLSAQKAAGLAKKAAAKEKK